ncbi:two-component system response regulator [Variovorax paradoxus]|jgi:two-component system copper resistance phosphate regulon response regulator CusR|uniref:heavy metal response regulator transcription factor n=1 Tax=Variovorax paradoxus TaxID=34073 RepID=UPI0006E5D44E|nr:two-component system response regulator [Variovorax paradoxus]KPV07271.1 two-component system response regulator [Variovorax paradoxus]KPV12098.1 two-component system response regulator [Variovorax paradoxus]KPV21305.1 two-component system response regulator [Variovorax paradoxus]KPV21352.1 two-component system response regulator [Variovorax paradoxus]
MRVLVVEDHPKLADYLRKGLTENGYVVDVAADGIDGRHLAVNGEYDIVVLDVMLPGLDGFAVLKAIRAAKDVAVLMLTARDQVEDRVRGLQDGADDYLVKPFAFSELLARLTALRRRGVRSGGTSEPTTLTLGDLQLDLARRKASRGGQALELTNKEFLILALLMRRRGEVLSRTVIAEQVWDMNFDSDTNVVEVAVRRLRAKLDDPFETPMLRTVRGMGYVLESA